MATIRDIALRAGVSVATVSRVLNGLDTVNSDLARRVKEVADELDYHPNAIARSLRRRATDLVALIVSDVADPFYTAVVRGVEDVAQARGYSVLLCNADEDATKEARYLRVAEVEQVAGVVLSPHSERTDVSRLAARRVPLVVVDRPLSVDTDSVMVPSAEGAYEATRHLLDEGWLRVACITGPLDARTAIDRLAGYRRAVADRRTASERAVHERFTVQGGRDAAIRLLDDADPPDALFIANTQMALGALSELRDRGLQVGRDVGIVTFDDAPWAPYIDPPMSVVAQPAYDIGTVAAQQLFRRIAGDTTGAPETTVLSTRLIVRQSSRRPPT